MRTLSLWLSLLLTGALAACTASAPSSPPATSAAPAEPADPGAGEPPTGDANSHLMVAEIALQRGDYHTAATEYAAAARLLNESKGT